MKNIKKSIVALILLVTFILAFISSMTKDPTSLTGGLSLAALIVSGAVSGFGISKANGEGGALVGILSSIITASVILVIGLIVSTGKLNLGVFLNLIAYMMTSTLASILGKKRLKRRKRKYS
jgi:putative membrane protein (TIGR04086 family)